ncbi:HpcH/HpaI aldolase/citrate lyase family protein [Thalassospira xiamenensis]|uniref:Citrate lyase beta subunit n=1 Tax=Thalassospira xiamenensis TaxID=220697 RepID=A0A285TSM6_9PROT|nr:HpcH/HpaI aldolase/citrate lyase family protein [Thalassospira xiamenensis]SOC26520.1 Citrate lyase beta subunit [Thalassospira xiamenensis]
MQKILPEALGASLYIPATRKDISAHANGLRLPYVRSMIFCTEDSIGLEEVSLALNNLRKSLPSFKKTPNKLRFIRVRNASVMGQILSMEGASNVDGFVLPKITAGNIGTYLDLLSSHDKKFHLMPTLETAEVFDHEAMKKLRDLLLVRGVQERILSLRIGGNDLFSVLGIRRSPERTIYETGLGHTIGSLASTFKPHGFNLTAPVFESFAHPEVLKREVVQDLDHGLFGKTAIHPSQIPLIEHFYGVSQQEFEVATAILQDDAPAVFNMHNTMCEPATHRAASLKMVTRAEVYGIRDENLQIRVAI